jgi:hypothetical protein
MVAQNRVVAAIVEDTIRAHFLRLGERLKVTVKGEWQTCQLGLPTFAP